MFSKAFPFSLPQLAPFVFVVLWSTGFVGSRMGAPYSEPMTFLSLRFGSVMILLLILSLALGAKWPTPRQSLHAFISGFMIHGIYLSGVFWAIDDGMPAGLFALVTGLQPVLTAFFAHAILKETINRNHVIGLGLGLVGISLVLLPRLHGGAFSVTPQQICVAVIAIVGISLGTVYQKRFASNLDMRTATIWQYLAALLLCGSLSCLLESQTIIWSGAFIFALGWLVLVLSIGAIFMLLWLIEHGAVSNTASLFYLVPAVTAVISFLLFDEPITLLQIVGMIITAASVILASRKAG
ncbi:DMT family transporter [uncultured Cohaesibacter sp.]|uniref:DMT family transporter n=1 Tax=uncultured Cohaesibacter sp. TaxID=1002546 RepID=UPI002930D5D3|nr:DMT family transporter [uncultured Cohaesibacter sp.]